MIATIGVCVLAATLLYVGFAVVIVGGQMTLAALWCRDNSIRAFGYGAIILGIAILSGAITLLHWWFV